jgi:oligopeptide/dipeptide ABC transporter ATP-binding protein
MSALLEVRDLHVRFPLGGGVAGLFGGGGSIEAVAGVGFDLGRGETLGLVGESGSGKTTLARAVAGLGGDVTGTVLFDGRPVLGRIGTERQALRREIAFIQQDAVSSLSPRFTVERLLKEPFRIHRLPCPDGEVERLLGLVGLPAALAGRHPHELSGGQARRVGVARAIALGPRLVIADEPTAGLDVSVQGEVLNLLNELRERLGLALLIITHNLNVVRHVADRMAIMYLGRFVETGNTEQVFHDPRHPYTAALLSANPVIDAAARGKRIKLEGEVPSLLRRPSGCEFHVRCPFARPDCAAVPPPLVQDGGRSFTCHYPVGVGSPKGARLG